MQYSFFVPGKPQPQSRPRFAVRKNRYGKVIGTVAVDEKKSRTYKEWVYSFALRAFNTCGRVFLHGPLEVRLIVFREIPQSFTKKKIREIEDGLFFPTQKPDLDNYIKAALDGVGMKDRPKVIFSDDSQVVRIISEKRYAIQGQTGMAIEIKELLPTVARESFVKEERVNG